MHIFTKYCILLILIWYCKLDGKCFILLLALMHVAVAYALLQAKEDVCILTFDLENDKGSTVIW